MTEGLKEKTKTFYELGKEWMETKVVDDRNNEKWVLVSVAQQEIDKLKTFRDNAYKKWCDSQEELERERGLQKQKLDKLIDELKHRPSEKGASYSTYQEGWLDGMALAIQKFEELLRK